MGGVGVLFGGFIFYRIVCKDTEGLGKRMRDFIKHAKCAELHRIRMGPRECSGGEAIREIYANSYGESHGVRVRFYMVRMDFRRGCNGPNGRLKSPNSGKCIRIS